MAEERVNSERVYYDYEGRFPPAELKPDAPETREITGRVKQLEGEGYEYEAAEASLALLIRRVLKHNLRPRKTGGPGNRNVTGTNMSKESTKDRDRGMEEVTAREGTAMISSRNTFQGHPKRAALFLSPC